jgi:hypothetical protein
MTDWNRKDGVPTPGSRVDGVGDREDAVTLDDQTQLQLGRILNRYSQDLINQPIPDSFLALLAKLEAREREA